MRLKNPMQCTAQTHTHTLSIDRGTDRIPGLCVCVYVFVFDSMNVLF